MKNKMLEKFDKVLDVGAVVFISCDVFITLLALHLYPDVFYEKNEIPKFLIENNFEIYAIGLIYLIFTTVSYITRELYKKIYEKHETPEKYEEMYIHAKTIYVSIFIGVVVKNLSNLLSIYLKLGVI